jgi:hypothetical protein
MKTCKYGRNQTTQRCNRPCFLSRQKIVRGPNGECLQKIRKFRKTPKTRSANKLLLKPKIIQKKKCPVGKERVHFLTHSECLPECDYRNLLTKQCENVRPDKNESDQLDFIQDMNSFRETQTGQRL